MAFNLRRRNNHERDAIRASGRMILLGGPPQKFGRHRRNELERDQAEKIHGCKCSEERCRPATVHHRNRPSLRESQCEARRAQCQGSAPSSTDQAPGDRTRAEREHRLEHDFPCVVLTVNASRANNDSKQGHRYQGRPQQKPECESADDSYLQSRLSSVLMQFACGTRILRVVHGRDARATFPNCISALSSKFIERPANGKPRDDTEGNSAEELRPDRDNDGCVYGPE